jgi:uncharacterized protein (DUF302 family)
MFITVRTRKSLGEVRQAFEDAAARHKFGIMGVHDVAERLRAKGLEFGRRLYVYEVCNPPVAKRVLDANIQIGAALPCRVSIYTDGDDIVLETLRPTLLLSLFQTPSLSGAAEEVERALSEMMEAAAK